MPLLGEIFWACDNIKTEYKARLFYSVDKYYDLKSKPDKEGVMMVNNMPVEDMFTTPVRRFRIRTDISAVDVLVVGA